MKGIEIGKVIEQGKKEYTILGVDERFNALKVEVTGSFMPRMAELKIYLETGEIVFRGAH